MGLSMEPCWLIVPVSAWENGIGNNVAKRLEIAYEDADGITNMKGVTIRVFNQKYSADGMDTALDIVRLGEFGMFIGGTWRKPTVLEMDIITDDVIKIGKPLVSDDDLKNKGYPAFQGVE